MQTERREKWAPADYILGGDVRRSFVCRLDGLVDHTLPENQHFYPIDVLEPPFLIPGYQLSAEEITPNSGKPRKAWKNFEHYKCGRAPAVYTGRCRVESTYWSSWPHTLYTRFGHGRFGTIGYNYAGSYYEPFGEPGLPISGLPKFYEKRELDAGFVPLPSNLESLVAKSLRKMLPDIKAELSTVNSAIELKDFATLPHDLKGIAKVLFKYNLKGIGKTLREITRVTAGSYLQLKFNISPFLSDICAVWNALSQVEAKMNDLVTRSRKSQFRHFVYNWNEYSDVSDGSDGMVVYPPYFSGGNSQIIANQLRRDVKYTPSVFHAQIRYNFNYSKYQIEHARLLTLLDMLGINPNPQIIWNAIPWSFVVDWVLNVGSYLKDHFGRLNMEPKINIQNYLWSIRRQRRINCTVHQYPTGPNIGDRDETDDSLPQTVETSYRRAVGLPERSLIESSGLSSQEFTLGAALVLSRRRKPRKR